MRVSRRVCLQYAKIVQKLGFQATFKEFKIQNIVGSCDVKFPIRLEGLSFSMSMFCNYEPEIFPGLIYRMKVCAPVGVHAVCATSHARALPAKFLAQGGALAHLLHWLTRDWPVNPPFHRLQEPKVVLLIFVSGKVVLTGAKLREEIYKAFENIYPVLQDFRKGDAHAPPALMPPPAAGVALQAPTEDEDNRMPPPSPARHYLPPPSPAHPGLPPPTPLHMSLPPPSPYVDNAPKSMF